MFIVLPDMSIMIILEYCSTTTLCDNHTINDYLLYSPGMDSVQQDIMFMSGSEVGHGGNMGVHSDECHGKM